MKQHAPAFERNKDPIVAVLREVLSGPGLVLEIGSGTGQHAAYFARRFPGLTWQPSERPEYLGSIAAWRDEAALPNLNAPVALDLFDDHWPVAAADAVLCINAIHIVAWEAVERLFERAGQVLGAGGIMCVYGPYRYPDRVLEPSNVRFDEWLRTRDPASGVRDFDAVNALADGAGLALEGDRAMPANNRAIWWRKRSRE